MTKRLANELAPIRVNLIAAGFVDAPMSAGPRRWARRAIARSSGRRCRSGVSSASIDIAALRSTS